MHIYRVEDTTGNLVDLVEFCSNRCLIQWCHDHNETYHGWDGCHEASCSTLCVECGDLIEGLDEGLAPEEQEELRTDLRKLSQWPQVV